MKPVELAWRLQLRASPAEAWAVMSDTDGFNRHAGFGFRFTRDGGEVQGRSSVGGFTSTWDELPMSFVAPRWFLSQRRMHQGPVASVKARCELEERGDGCELRYRIELMPRSRWARPAVAAVAQLDVKRKVRRALDGVEAALRGQDSWAETPPLLHARQHRALKAGLQDVRPSVADALRRRVERAPLASQHCLRARQLASQEGLSEAEATLGMLEAVAGGALQLRWALVCPSCRQPQSELEQLSAARGTPHCDSCGIRFDGALGDHVEALFRVHPDVRDDEVVVHCAMSPGRTPHVVARVDVAAGEAAEVPLELAVGAYRVDVGGEQVLLEVAPSLPPQGLVVRAASAGVRPRRLITGPGAHLLTVISTRREVTPVVVAQRWQPPFVQSAASLLSVPGAAPLVGQARLGDEVSVTLRHGWALVLAGEADDLDRALADATPQRVERRRSHVAVCVVPTAAEALSLAEACMFAGRQLSVGVASGAVSEVRSAHGLELGGRAVDQATACVERVGRPRVVVDAEAAASEELAEALARQGEAVAVRERPDGRCLWVFMTLFAAETAPADDEPDPDALDELELPERVGPYVVLRELDRGGMGMVLECLDEGSGQRVAVKVMLPFFASHAGLQQRFFNEAWYSRRIESPHVVKVLDFGLEGEQPWMAMEFLTGDSLAAHLRRKKGRLAVGEAWDLLRPVLLGLQALHAEGLVHRDLKPANVFLVYTEAGRPPLVKLLDFGLVRRAGVRRDEGLAGTPDYMAPEQLLGDVAGPPVDVFAAAVLLVRMVVGRYPFAGAGPRRAVARVEHDAVTVDLAVFGAAETVVRRALAVEAADRYADAGAFRVALEEVWDR